jgi:hypothetical protein
VWRSKAECYVLAVMIVEHAPETQQVRLCTVVKILIAIKEIVSVLKVKFHDVSFLFCLRFSLMQDIERLMSCK